MREEVGVILGRFQINELHTGHIALLDYVKDRYDRMIILVGVRPAEQSDTNPLSFEARKAMLLEAFPDAYVVPILDMRSDEEWSKNVDKTIQTIYGYGCKATFHVGRDSFAPHYSGKYPIKEHAFTVHDFTSTEVRDSLRSDILNTPEARAGAINAIMNLPHRHTLMVDMYMIRPDGMGGWHVLVGKKEGETKWRLPGGHVDADESCAMAASRELAEETGLHTVSGAESWRIIGDFNVPDWRVRDTDRITYKTMLMTAEHSWGNIKAGSDLPEVTWLHRRELKYPDIKVVEEHVHLFQAAEKYLENNPPHFILHPSVEEEIA